MRNFEVLSPRDAARALVAERWEKVTWENDNYENTVVAVKLDSFSIEEVIQKLLEHGKSTYWQYGQEELRLEFNLYDTYVRVINDCGEEVQEEGYNLKLCVSLYQTSFFWYVAGVDEDNCDHIWETEGESVSYEAQATLAARREVLHG